MTRDEAIATYRAARAAYYEAVKREDASFMRWFEKARAGEKTNAAGATRMANATNEASRDLYSAQSDLYRIEIDPWDIDDEDGVERTPVGY